MLTVSTIIIQVVFIIMCSTLLLQRQETATTASTSTTAHTIGRRCEIDDELFHHRPAADTSHFFIDSISSPKSPPRNLPNVVFQRKLPVAFRTLRELLLDSNKSQFRIDDILKHKLHYKNISMSEWDHHNDAIGRINNHNPLHHHHHLIDYDHLQQKKYIGAIRQTNYQIPKTPLVDASMAYETAVITEYNDDCFAIRLTTFTPTVPFGERFVSITQIVVTKTAVEEAGGEDSDESDICEMIVSVDVQYPNPKVKPMTMIRNRIKNGVIQGARDVYEKTSAVILSTLLGSE